MANHHCRRSVSSTSSFLTLAGTNARRPLALATALVFSVTCFAQDQAQPPSTPEPQTNQAPATPPPAIETLPAGTRFTLVLTNSISSNTAHRGDEVQAQTVAPIAVGDHVVIPAGVFVQGKLDKIRRDGSRGVMLMQSAKVIFPDGYVANITTPLTIETEEGTAWLNPSGRTTAGMIIAPMAGLGLGALLGNAAHTTQSTTLGGTTLTSSTPKGIAIGSMVGLGVGGGISLALLIHSHQFFVDVGSPMEMTLPQPLTLTENHTPDAVRVAQENALAVPMLAPRSQPLSTLASAAHGTCFIGGTMGTPSTVIPGTPPIGNSPGTPSTVIPGIPATPPTPYPCP
jgi:hypothetical protein